MSDRWESFAQEDAEYFIWTDLDRSQGELAMQKFFASGEAAAQRLLDFAGSQLRMRRRSLEIGCGVGRLTLAMAKHFDEAVGVDIAPTMLSKLSANAERAERANVRGELADADWDRPDSVDFAYSWLVFQHIEAAEIIDRYLQRIARSLSAEGIACLQFDTRPRGLAYRLRFALPSFLLPRTWRPGIRRIRRDGRWLRERCAAAGLTILREQGAGSDVHLFLLARRD
jgi:SAM-dependent methyltransferase